MNIQENISLKFYNTFGIDAKARFFVSVNSVAELREALALEAHPNPFILGGGSNMLLTKDINRLVIHINLKGIKEVSQNKETLYLQVAGGENWHEFVLHCVSNDWGGVENMSLIPGNVGTAPIQNIGAYGVELKDVFHSCTTVHRVTGEVREFTLEDCAFDYRDSYFKNEGKDAFVITDVTFKLTTSNHNINTDYGAIYDTLIENGIKEPTLKAVSDAVISIRQSKLPDPAEIGNSGSFFKNPIVNQATFNALRKEFPELPYYPVGSDQIKVPAGWLIETAGFKGKRFGDAGVHDKQALVLVNHGNASGAEVWEVAMKIQTAVKDMFGLLIIPEVNVV